ncbi:MAG: hypothetical protein DWQ37_09910 [Planctomycetota bacterium]|nr:MAG: hypothetical protein DWQ37_09910 [Planctomycetota bacterium]
MASTTTSAKRSRKNRAVLTSGPGGPWSATAPRRIRTGYQGEDERGWESWCRHLAKRRVRPLAKLFKGRHPALFWALPAETPIDEAEKVIDLVRRPRAADRDTAGLDNAVVCWLSRADVAPADFGFALECLAWCWALPELSEHVGEHTWWQLYGRLVTLASAEARPDDPLAESLLHVELPTMCAYLFPEVAESERLVDAAHRALDRCASPAADREPLVHGSRLEELRALVACWTRTRVVSHLMRRSPWDDSTLREYARLVEHALRLTRPDRRQVFTESDSPRWMPQLLKAAIGELDHAKTRRLAQLVIEGGKGADTARRRAPRTSFELESGGLAVLRANWQRRSPQLAVNYAQSQLFTELTLGKQCLWSGPAELEVRFDGQTLTARQPWEQICWESDDDIEYLELELRLSEDITVQRLMALGREDGFLFLADAVLGVRPGKFEYRAALPLGQDVSFLGEQETREGTIEGPKEVRARVLPLALGEWRCGPTSGSLEMRDGRLELTQEAVGCRLFAPLFVDLNRRRMRDEVTWRQLTVGQDRVAVPRDEAVGYRVQIGRSQWLLYRSLSAATIRTVLGKNLLNELLIGRFGAGGQVDALLEIEG